MLAKVFICFKKQHFPVASTIVISFKRNINKTFADGKRGTSQKYVTCVVEYIL